MSETREKDNVLERKEENEEDSNNKCGNLMRSMCVGSDAKWTILRFAGLCLFSVLILVIVYAARTRGGHGGHSSHQSLYGVGDSVYPRDLWLIIELPCDARGLRTKLGRSSTGHVCSAIRAGQSVGWTPLVVGGKSKCCRSSRCRHLHPTDIPKMNHTTASHYFFESEDVTKSLRSAAFLAAIERGAHFIFHATPETYYLAGVSTLDYRRELERQLRKMTLGISVGMVKENEIQDRRDVGFQDESDFFDPYVHFGPEYESKIYEYKGIQKYKVCEIRPPSIEKFLDTDGSSLDLSAPPLTVPGSVSAPFDSRNSLFNRDSFWSLMVLPNLELGSDGSTEIGEEELKRENFFLRSIIAQAIMSEIDGSTKFSVGNTPLGKDLISFTMTNPKIIYLEQFLRAWSCSTNTAFTCLKDLIVDLTEYTDFFNDEHIRMADMWIQDLKAVGYRNSETVAESLASPCIGNDALFDVYFHPSHDRYTNHDDGLKEPSKDRTPKKLELDLIDGDTSSSPAGMSEAVLNRLCPSIDFSEKMAEKHGRNENLLLIVNFYDRKNYDAIPLFEVIYRHHFKNILYCGYPDEIVDQYAQRYEKMSGEHFSFLPVHTKTGYECLLGAIEMGFNVEGFIMVNQDTLVNSWNFDSLDPKVIWHGNEHAQIITEDNIEKIEGKEGKDKIMRSTKGLIKAFEFLEDVLVGGWNDKKEEPVEIEEEKDLQNLSTSTKNAHHPHHHRRRRNIIEQRHLQDTLVTNSTEINYEYGLSPSSEHSSIFEESDKYKIFQGEEDDSGSEDVINETEETPEENVVGLQLNIFGEIINEPGTQDKGTSPMNSSALSPDRNLTELLFHPANFLFSSAGENSDEESTKNGTSHSVEAHFTHMLFDLQMMYQSIGDKLNHWRDAKSHAAKQHEDHAIDHDNDTFIKEVEDNRHIYCDSSSNSEICYLVSGFFEILKRNEGDDFRLFYDDLPIYYVPITSPYKDQLYLMANLFTKYHIDDEIAFPLLLRGLSDTSSWATLTRSTLLNDTVALKVETPEDLLLDQSEDLERQRKKIAELEKAHYLYPINMRNILKNDVMKNIICKNF